MKPKIPDSFKSLPASTFLTSRDLAAIYGVKVKTIQQYHCDGLIPKAVTSHHEVNKQAQQKNKQRNPKMYSHTTATKFWLLGDIRQHVKTLGAQ